MTQNIGSHLGIPNIEKGLETYRSTDSISFLDYLYYLKVELFNQTSDNRTSGNRSSDEKSTSEQKQKHEQNANFDFSKVNEVCWMLCSSKYLSREKKLLKNNDVYRLWRLFNFLSETDSNGELVYPVVTHIDEVGLIVSRIWSRANQVFDDDAYREACCGFVEFKFPQMLQLLETTCLEGLAEDVVSTAIKEVYDEYIVEVLKKVSQLKGYSF